MPNTASFAPSALGAFALRVCAALVLLVGLVVAPAAATGCSATDDQAVASPCPPGKRCQVSLTVLHTADIHSRLFPYEQVITQLDATLGLGVLDTVANVGGVARMGYIVNRERARAGRLIHLDSGDCFQGAPVFNFFKGEPEVRTLSALGVDAAVLGNHEFDFGPQNVATQFQRWSNFALLSANYRYTNSPQDVAETAIGRIGTVTRPFTILNTGGLKIAAIGMANLSSLTSIFDQPNKVGITPLQSVEVLQFYIDLLRPYVDLVGVTSHMGLEVDQRMVRSTTGLDFIMGGHNHTVINPPQEIKDCSADPTNPGFVWAVDPNAQVDPDLEPPDDPEPELKGKPGNFDPIDHPFQFKRACKPRRVVISHSGAFAKYVGRLDLVVSNEAEVVSPTGNPADYDPVNGFEVVNLRYQVFPINDQVPEDPVIVDILQPYRRALDNAVDLDILVGYSPLGSRRISSTGGDSPLGNLVGNSIWLRLGVQTDFSLTNSTGIRTDLNPGPVTIEQMYNIFPFDNSIAKMQLSGKEVQELFDFSAKRSARRGCSSQIQIAGARVRLNCTGCDRLQIPCEFDEDCRARGRDRCDIATRKCVADCETDDDCRLKISGATCDTATRQCVVEACAEQVYIGNTDRRCKIDAECAAPGDPVLPGVCDLSGTRAPGRCQVSQKRCISDSACSEPGRPAPPGSCVRSNEGLCMSLISPTNLYELATSVYLAQGGSGFRVLQRNTTQFDTKIQQRDALIDYLRAGHPCGWDPANLTPDGLKSCSTDAECAGGQVCSCPGHVVECDPQVTPRPPECGQDTAGALCRTNGACEGGNGRCVLATCRNEAAQFHLQRCANAANALACRTPVAACELAGEECKILACIDATAGSFTDGRVELIGR